MIYNRNVDEFKGADIENVHMRSISKPVVKAERNKRENREKKMMSARKNN